MLIFCKILLRKKKQNYLMINKSETPKEGYIIDYVAGQSIKATPEEIEAVQVFSRQLVEDYNYPKDHIQTRPQFRVKRRPSDTKKNILLTLQCFLIIKNKKMKFIL